MAKLLPMQPAPDLKAARETLLGLAKALHSAEVRQPAWAAIATADETTDQIWSAVEKSPKEQVDVLSAIPMIFDQDIRFKAYDKVKPLIGVDLPPALVAETKNAHSTTGRFVRIELPKKGAFDIGRSPGLQRRPKHRPVRQGHAIHHRQWRRCPSSH